MRKSRWQEGQNQGHLQLHNKFLHNKFKAYVDYMRPCLKKSVWIWETMRQLSLLTRVPPCLGPTWWKKARSHKCPLTSTHTLGHAHKQNFKCKECVNCMYMCGVVWCSGPTLSINYTMILFCSFETESHIVQIRQKSNALSHAFNHSIQETEAGGSQ